MVPIKTRETFFTKILETFIVASTSCLFFTTIFQLKLAEGARPPSCPDYWLSCFLLENDVTRMLGINPGGLWEGGYCYPFHKISLLFNEPTWGVSLAVLPLWLLIRNIFLIHETIGGIIAIILACCATYWFARELNCKRVYAFFAAITFSLSGISLCLIPNVYFFWPFFLIPCLAIIMAKIFKEGRLLWYIAFAVIYAYLGWCSAHLFIMGGLFLLFFMFWQILSFKDARKKSKGAAFSFLSALLLTSPVYIPMFLVRNDFPSPDIPEAQFFFSTNIVNLIYHPLSIFGPLNSLKPVSVVLDKLASLSKGESPIGISLCLWCFSFVYIGFFFLHTHMNKKFAQPLLRCIFYYLIPIVLAVLNMFTLKFFIPGIDIGIPQTFICYYFAGVLVVFFRNKLRLCLNDLPFFLLASAFVLLLLAFGPYYHIGWGKVMPSPVVIPLYVIPGISGIRAVARWGLIVSFMISVALALILSFYRRPGLWQKLLIAVFMLTTIVELFPGFLSAGVTGPFIPYQWKNRQADVFLKNMPDRGAVLEFLSYPVTFESLGPDMYASLYHKKPIVIGHATVIPFMVKKYIYGSQGDLTLGRINELRNFGAKYWVFHLDQWDKKYSFLSFEKSGALKKIVSLDSGNTVIYEDPNPKINVAACIKHQ